MKLQTQIPLVKRSNHLIDYSSNILLFGSCFVENIGEKLNYFKFQNLQNPFGVLFHPKAIETLITRAFDRKAYTEADIFFHNEQWHSFDAHSKLSNSSKENLLQDLNKNIDQTYDYIKKATHVVVTLGTAWVYKALETDKTVANCHKVPQKAFRKELLSVTEVIKTLETIVQLIKTINSNVSIIFTVSPIRHLKDGFLENTQSKAHLVTAIHDVIANEDHAMYFPSYEIMMDELRDYRFYAEDMIHPSPLAMDCIWERFKKVWMADASFKTMEQVDVVQKGLMHRPFNAKSKAYQKFILNLKEKQTALTKAFPHITF